MAAANTPADFTASIMEKFLKHAHELPSSYCRRRFLDLQFLRMDAEDPKSVVARKLTPAERKGLLAERAQLLFKCIASPDSPPAAPFLYEPKEAPEFTGGVVERQRALKGKLDTK